MRRLPYILLLSTFILLSLVGARQANGQATATATLTPSPSLTPVPPITISSLNPSSMVSGRTSPLAINGTNFTANTTIEIVGVGPLPATIANANLINAVVPRTLASGQYTIQASDPVGGTAQSPSLLAILDPTATLTQTPSPITINHTEPSQVVAGQGGQLSVIGGNFTANSTVRLIGVGFLSTTFVNSAILTATLPDTLTAGQYSIEVDDPAGGIALSPTRLLVIGPTPLPPTEAPQPTLTLVPTPIPGQPSLYVRSFTVAPRAIAPGATTALTFEIVNQGNYEARSVAVSVDDSGKFIPANGQASDTLPNIPPGGSTTGSLRVIASADVAAGPSGIPLSITYADADAKTYTSKANLSVTILKINQAPQVLLTHYVVDPNPVKAGMPVHLKLDLANVGNQPAFQVLVNVPGKDGILLPGEKGDSFSAGTLNAGGKAKLDLPLVVTSDAKSGSQIQALTISYLLDGKVEQITGSITISVVKPIVEEPLLVLDSYDAGPDTLKPGDQFQLKGLLKNIGKGVAQNLVVSFGNNTNVTDNGSGTPASSGSTNPGNTFAPLKSGGTLLLGKLDGDGGQKEIAQDFIVNANVSSGVYSLPITVRYQRDDGTSVSTNLAASVVVVNPAQVQVTLEETLPNPLTVATTQSLSLKVTNTGKDKVNLSTLTVKAINAQIVEGGENPLKPMDPSGEVNIAASLIPGAEGPVTITITLSYLDDLNHEHNIVKTYDTQAVAPPPTPMPFTPPPVTEEPPESGDFWGRLLFGLLGLGS